MAIKKVTGDPEIDAIISSLHKQFGKTDLITVGPNREPVKAIPTGAMALDIATGIGGIPVGAIVEIFGPESSCKTSLSLKILASYMQNRKALGHEERKPLIIDLEHTMGVGLMQGLGLDPDEVIFTRPDTAEEAFQTIIDLVKTGRIGIVLVDSVDAAQSMTQIKRKVGEVHMGGISKIMSEVLRELSKLCSKTETTCIFINQIRQNPGTHMGNPNVTPGGKALPFYSSLRLGTLPHKPSANVPNAMLTRLRIKKNKVASPRSDIVEFDFIYAKGPDPVLDVITTAKSLDLAYFGGSHFMVKWPEGDGSAERIASGGTIGAAAYLRKNPKTMEKLKTACLQTAGITPILHTIEAIKES